MAYVARLSRGEDDEPSPEAEAGGILAAEMAQDLRFLREAYVRRE